VKPYFVLLVILSALLHASWNFFTKASRSPQIFLLWKGVATCVLTAIVFTAKFPGDVSLRVWMFIIASGLVHVVYWYSLGAAYASGDISYVYPIARSASGIVPILAFFFLGEVPSVQGVAGIVLIVISIYLLQFRDGASDLAGILAYLKRHDAIWAFMTLSTVVGYSLVDKAGMAAFHASSGLPKWYRPIVFYLAIASLSFIGYGVTVFVRFPMRRIMVVGRREWKLAFLGGLMTFASYSLILFVMETEKVGYIVSIRQSSVVFGVLLGVVFLKEAYGKLRVIASVLIVLGVILIAAA